MTSSSDPSKKVPNLADVPDEDETLVIKVSFHLLFDAFSCIMCISGPLGLKFPFSWCLHLA